MCGTWMQTVGQAWLVLKLTGSGTALGLVIALQFLPVLFLGPFGGVLVDRLPTAPGAVHHPVRARPSRPSSSACSSPPTPCSSGRSTCWPPASGLVAAVDNPIRQTFVLEMVGPENLSNAVTLNSVMLNGARIIGPAIAGLLIATVGLAACFYINAASYLAVLAALALMKVERAAASCPRPAKAKGQLAEGFRYVRSTPVLRDSLVMMAIVGTLSYEFQVLLPLVAKYTFHGTAATYSALTAAMGAGAVVGGLLTASRHHHGPMALVKATLALGVVILVAAAAPTLTLEMVALVAVGAAVDHVPLPRHHRPAARGRAGDARAGDGPLGGRLHRLHTRRRPHHRLHRPARRSPDRPGGRRLGRHRGREHRAPDRPPGRPPARAGGRRRLTPLPSRSSWPA